MKKLLLFLTFVCFTSTLAAKPKTHKWVEQRFDPDRIDIVEEYGGSEATEKAVEAALAYLARTQKKDGTWASEGPFRVSSTALPVLAFYAAGYNNSKGKYKKVLSKAFKYLFSQTNPKKKTFSKSVDLNYGGALLLTVFNEYQMVGGRSKHAKTVSDKMTLYFNDLFNGYGWRYSPEPENSIDGADMSVSGWVAFALKLSEANKLKSYSKVKKNKIIDQYFEYVNTMIDVSSGKARYENPKGSAILSMGMISNVVSNLYKKNLSKGFSNNHGIALTNSIDPNNRMNFGGRLFMQNQGTRPYYAYWGTLSAFQYQGEIWKKWNESMKKYLLAKQVKEESKRKKLDGSWSEKGSKVGDEDGSSRAMTTAIYSMCLSTYYRYPVFKDLKK